jgi:hypothetical protein
VNNPALLKFLSLNYNWKIENREQAIVFKIVIRHEGTEELDV